jgi:hypothetical protein
MFLRTLLKRWVDEHQPVVPAEGNVCWPLAASIVLG